MVGSVGMSGFMPPMMRPGGMTPPSFEQIDANGDKGISLDEFTSARKNLPGAAAGADSARLEERFKAMDTDSSGAVSEEELAAFRSQKAQAHAALLQLQEQFGGAIGGMAPPSFEELDANGDKGITLDEFTEAGKNLPGGPAPADSAQVEELFAAIDADSSGTVSEEELAAFRPEKPDSESILLQLQEQLGGETGTSGQSSIDEVLAALAASRYRSTSSLGSDAISTLLSMVDQQAA